jgi:hypothetical protein
MCLSRRLLIYSSVNGKRSLLANQKVYTQRLPFSFVNMDFALARSMRQCGASQLSACSDVKSYDISCAYSVNIVERFTRSFPDCVDAIRRAVFLIPAVHVTNHKDNCMYRYSSVYTPNVGHFHGETAEHYWPELNQVGAQTRQMNNGHRHDTIIDHHSDWNWKKIANMGKVSLPNPII